MRHPIRYEYVAPGTEKFEKLQEFAGSFDHTIVSHPQINVYAHYRDNVCFGYCDHVFVPTIYPAFHPEFTRPRDVVQVMSDYTAHSQLSGKPLYVGVPLDNARPNFPESTMNKLGLARINREVYCPM